MPATASFLNVTCNTVAGGETVISDHDCSDIAGVWFTLLFIAC